tara:strand:+ start:64 stop:198 length:135 start_codon:yes stop_codon:yes gene_type:complete
LHASVDEGVEIIDTTGILLSKIQPKKDILSLDVSGETFMTEVEK